MADSPPGYGTGTIRERSGSLQGRGDGTEEFPHLPFQEYLAARHIHIVAGREPDYVDLLLPHLNEVRCREVHLWTIG